MLSGDVKRVSEEFFKAYLNAVYGRVYGFVAFEGVMSVLTLYGAANALYWKSSKRKIPCT